jgi:hypothetical protein
MPLIIFLVRGDMVLIKEYQETGLFVKFGLISFSLLMHNAAVEPVPRRGICLELLVLPERSGGQEFPLNCRVLHGAKRSGVEWSGEQKVKPVWA